MNVAARLSIVDKVRRASYRKNRLAMCGGALLGGFVPLASYVLAHHEVQERPALWSLIAGALLFSARSVYDFGVIGFRSSVKALGFVVLLEGVMVFSGTWWLAFAALALLIAVNGIETGSNLALDHIKVEPQQQRQRAPRRARSRSVWAPEPERGGLLSIMESR